MVWNAALPTTGSKMVDTATIYPDNWVAIEEWLSVNHYTFTEATSGLHHPGETAIISAATSVEITAMSAPGSGAIGWSTDRGHLMCFVSGGWWELPKTYQEGDLEVSTTSTSAFHLSKQIICDHEDNDPYSQHSVTTGIFTASKSGKYLVTGTFCFSQDINPATSAYGEGGTYLYIQHTKSDGTLVKLLTDMLVPLAYEGDILGSSVPKYTLQVTGCLELTATDRLLMFVHNGSNYNTNVISGGFTSLSIKRME